ncbi:MAG: hypothetical protein P4L64_11515 [Caulobacteraceae bacterium]|nr:hypothetical protein [Caulobacteraceae bacterium]
MPAPQSERALRRLVAELAGLEPQDVEGVLAELDPVPRRAVHNLLQAYLGVPATAPSNAASDTPDLEGLSPWLRERVERALGDTAGSPADLGMTPTAAAALVEASRLLPRRSAGAPRPNTSESGASESTRSLWPWPPRGRP